MNSILLPVSRASHTQTSLRSGLLWLLLSLTSLLMACADHRDPNPGNQNQFRLQAAVDSVRRALQDSLGHSVPSLNVLIQTPTQTYFASSVPTGQSPVTPNTFFRFASNTKNFTATAILNMYEDGWLDYKAKITDLIPGSTQPYIPATAEWAFPNKSQITIEQLLQHSAGVYDVDNDSVPGFNGVSYTEAVQTADPTHQFTTEEMVRQLILNQLSYFAPGTGYHYSNTGYSILSYIIARVYSGRSGLTKTYGDYLHDYVVGPGAPVPVTIRFPVRADDTVLPSPRVEGLVLLPGNIQKHYGDYNMSAQVGEGNGYGTMASLNTYIRSLMKGQNVLTTQTVKLMQTSVSSKNPDYGLGCTFTPNLGYGHNGARIGNLAVMEYDPLTDVSVVAYLPLWDLTNDFTSFIKCFNGMYDAAYAARKSLGYPGKP